MRLEEAVFSVIRLSDIVRDFKEGCRQLIELLQLKRPPIAIGVNKTRPRNLTKLYGKMAFCRMWKRALDGEAFFATADNHDCLTGGYYLGLIGENAGEAVCNFLVNQVRAFKSREIVKRYLSNVPMLKPGQLKTACLSPLDAVSFEPDIVIIVCDPEQAMLLLWAYSYDFGEPVIGYTGTATCRSTFIEPYLTGKPSFSLGDPGGRYIIQLTNGEVVVSIPAKLFRRIVKNLNVRINDWTP